MLLTVFRFSGCYNIYYLFYVFYVYLKHYLFFNKRNIATNRQVAGSIPDGVIRIFHWHIPAGRTMALRSTQPLTELSTRLFSEGKGGRYVRLTTLPPSCAVVMKSGNLNFLEPSGPLQACNGTALPSPYHFVPSKYFPSLHDTIAPSGPESLYQVFVRALRHTTFGRNALNKWSARRTDP
jgi:hypothetical protein